MLFICEYIFIPTIYQCSAAAATILFSRALITFSYHIIVQSEATAARDKTMLVKLTYIPNNDKQNHPFI